MAMREWLAYDALHPAPTFFARPGWALALGYAFPQYKPYPVRVRSGGESFVVPLVQVSGGRLNWREFSGFPYGGYTCVLRSDGTPASPAQFDDVLAILSKHSDSIRLTPWPLAPYEVPASWKSRTHETAVIDLSGGADEALRGLDGVVRRMAGQAERRGVECMPSRSSMGVSTYYAMLREASEHWGLGRPPFPRELLEGLVAYGGTDVEIWFAHADGHPIAGGVIFYGSEELFFWSAAMRQAYSRLRPSNALNVALIKAGCQRRMRWYNLGASEGLPGVERFKRGLGARMLDYREIHRERTAFTVYTRLRSSLRRVPAYQGAL